MDAAQPALCDLKEYLEASSGPIACDRDFQASTTVTMKSDNEIIGEIEFYSPNADPLCHATLERLSIVADRLGALFGSARDQQQLKLQGAGSLPLATRYSSPTLAASSSGSTRASHD